MADDEYLKEDAELKLAISKAEQEAPPEPRSTEPLKELLETDFEQMYLTLDEDDKQQFWGRLIREIKMDGKTIKDIDFL